MLQSIPWKTGEIIVPENGDYAVIDSRHYRAARELTLNCKRELHVTTNARGILSEELAGTSPSPEGWIDRMTRVRRYSEIVLGV